MPRSIASRARSTARASAWTVRSISGWAAASAGRPRQEPAVGEGGQHRDGQRAAQPLAAHVLDRAREAGEGRAELGQGAPPGRGELEAARQAAEQPDPE